MAITPENDAQESLGDQDKNVYDRFSEALADGLVRETDGDESQGEDETQDEPEPSLTPPSREMLAIAKMAGSPDDLISIARTSEDLDTLISRFQRPGPPAEPKSPEKTDDGAAASDEPLVKLLIPQDDYDDADPVHKQVKHVVDVVNAQFAELRKTNKLLVDHALSVVEERRNREAMELQTPFDEALDELAADALGDSRKGLTETQSAVRARLFDPYLAMIQGEAPERRKQLAEVLAQGKFAGLTTNGRAAEAAREQAKRKLGGSTGREPEKPQSLEQEFAKQLAAIARDRK